MAQRPRGNRAGVRWLLLFASAASCVGAVELAVRALDLFAEQRSLVATPAGASPPAETPATAGLLHPYQGWAMRPGAAPEIGYLDYLRRALPSDSPPDPRQHGRNRFGFRSPIDDYRDVPGSDYAVAITGGSVAATLCTLGAEALEARLAELRPELAGRVRVLNLATGGFKQPQQLFVLAQMLLLGVALDAVVNVDGYNEAVYGARDAQGGAHPLFPSRSHLETLVELGRAAPSEATVLASARILRARRAAAQIRGGAGEAWWSGSALARAVAGWRVERHLRRAAQLEGGLRESGAPGPEAGLLASLPAPCAGEERCAELVAELWEGASVLMARLSESAGARYLHVLQPNQYVAGSRRLTPGEREVAWMPDAQWARAARHGYPFLRARADALRARGVRFLDLTDLFRDTPEPIYVDPCCHYNRKGNRMLARRIAEELANF